MADPEIDAMNALSNGSSIGSVSPVSDAHDANVLNAATNNVAVPHVQNVVVENVEVVADAEADAMNALLTDRFAYETLICDSRNSCAS